MIASVLSNKRLNSLETMLTHQEEEEEREKRAEGQRMKDKGWRDRGVLRTKIGSIFRKTE